VNLDPPARQEESSTVPLEPFGGLVRSGDRRDAIAALAFAGAPRIQVELREQGLRVGRKRVARLMRAARLKGVSRRRWVTTTVRDHDAQPPPDLVERNFTASEPNHLWVADISYIPTWGVSISR
jgi:transposase InsO family protein